MSDFRFLLYYVLSVLAVLAVIAGFVYAAGWTTLLLAALAVAWVLASGYKAGGE